MTDNVIKLNLEQDEIAAAKQQLEEEIKQGEQQLAKAQDMIRQLTDREIELNIEIAKETKKDLLKQLRVNLKEVQGSIKKYKAVVENTSSVIQETRTSLGKLMSLVKTEQREKNSVSSIEKTFNINNIHYVVNGQKWWMVDPDGDRRSPKVISLTGSEMRDILYLDADWEVNSEQEIKRVAKESGRMFKHVVRDFNTAPRPNTYNQMVDIQKYWLKPVFDETPHVAFRLLCLSIAGGDEDYADQLERLVAYRYVHPEDVMIPNIDSCATGGTGRDTFFGIVRSIFTDECCATINEETISGTHNADLFGKMWVKVSEKDSRSIPIDKIKDLTGDRKYRHRAMGENAIDAVRLFCFMFFRNGYTTTAKLAGTGPSGEDRRFEPVIARYNLARHIALYTEQITDFNEEFTTEKETAATYIIKQWQQEVYQNDLEIAKWLGHIIMKHDVANMRELLPLHGKYYKEMIVRQQKGIEVFMPKLIGLMDSSNVINIKTAHKLYEISENAKVTKDWFKNAAVHWLNTKANWDCVVETTSVYPHQGANSDARRRFAIIRDANTTKDDTNFVFDVTDFIDPDIEIDGKINADHKITVETIRTDLL
jgi:hypothetical protein